MKIFIDFDDVIFNTKKFSADLKSLFRSQGVNEELFTKYYYSETADAMKVFDPWGMMGRLRKMEGIDTEKMEKSFDKILVNLDEYIFGDSRGFFKSIGKENVYLVSYGLAKMQEKKIKGSHTDSEVKKFIVVDNLKADAIAKIISEENIPADEAIFFIDDRAHQIEDVKKALPGVCTLLLCRKEGRYFDEKVDACDYKINNLSEAEEIIKSFS